MFRFLDFPPGQFPELSMTESIAGIKRRFLALVLDVLLLGVLGGAVSFPFENQLDLDLNDLIESVQINKDSVPDQDFSALALIFIHSALQTALWALYFIIFIGASGQTPGKKMLGLCVKRADGMSMDYKTAAARCLIGYPLCFLTFGLGFLWALWDKRKQGLHDKIANTLVVQTTNYNRTG